MEAWLKTDDISFKFPFVPQVHPVDTGYKINTEYLANGKQVSIFAGEDLKTVSLTGHFPSNADRTYVNESDFKDKWECVKIVEEIAKSKSEIRYIVTTTNINFPVKIQSFDYGPRDGSEDIEFTINFIEYDPPTIRPWKPSPATEKKVAKNTVQTKQRPTKKQNSNSNRKTHLVRHGDCLWDIAQKYYGNGRLYTKIKSNSENQKKYPKLKYSNVIYTGWELVIP